MAGSRRSLDEQTSDGILYNGYCRLGGVQILTDGTNDATVILYDNTAASGVKVFVAVVEGAADAELYDFSVPIKCKNGLYLDITGTGASCIPYLG